MFLYQCRLNFIQWLSFIFKEHTVCQSIVSFLKYFTKVTSEEKTKSATSCSLSGALWNHCATLWINISCEETNKLRQRTSQVFSHIFEWVTFSIPFFGHFEHWAPCSTGAWWDTSLVQTLLPAAPGRDRACFSKGLNIDFYSFCVFANHASFVLSFFILWPCTLVWWTKPKTFASCAVLEADICVCAGRHLET